ncbi:MAG: PAS domain S-box protein [Chloroflexi bacterium]|nr:PAS domain S-box protein [Chloroflexota bacterium]
MNWIIFIPFLAFGVAIALLIGTGKQARRTTSGRIFLYYLSLIAVGGFSSWMMHLNASPGAMFWLRVAIYVGPIVAVLLVYLATKFPQERERAKLLVPVWFGIAVFFLFANYAGWLLEDVEYLASGAVRISFTPLMIAAFVWTGLTMFITIFLFGISAFKARDSSERSRAVYCIIATAAVPIGGLVDSLPVARGYPIDQLANIFQALVLAFAITKHRLFGIETLLRRGALYGVLWAIFTGIYLVITWLLVGVLGQTFGLANVLGAILLALLMVALYKPLHPLFETAIDRVFYGGRYHQRQLLLKFSQTTAQIQQVEQLLTGVTKLICEAIDTSMVRILVPDSSGNRLVIASARPGEEFITASLENPGIQDVMKAREALLAVDVEAHIPISGPWRREWQTLQSLNGRVYVPMADSNGPIGILVIGQKSKDALYTDSDLSLLSTMGNYLVIALRNAQLYTRVLEAEEQYRTIIELDNQAGEGIVMLQDDERGMARHVYANDAWCAITGYSREELMKLSMADLIHPRHGAGAIADQTQQMWRGVTPGILDISIVRKNGTEVPIEVIGAYSTYQGKHVNVIYARDITEHRKMQEQLMAQTRLASIGQLTAGIAHEINNPLTSVIGFSEFLLARELPDDVKADLKVVNNEAQRTARIVKNLLTFARKQPEEKAPVDINEQIRRVLELRDHEQKVNNIRVITHFASDLPQVMGNGSQLQQVFFNIVINAEYFMLEAHQKGNLTVTTERVGDFVRCSFADDGPGIPREDMTSLFTPFFTAKPVGKGTGLGLSICYGIITEHGGRIYAESEPGKGTTFIIELPIKQPETNQEITR